VFFFYTRSKRSNLNVLNLFFKYECSQKSRALSHETLNLASSADFSFIKQASSAVIESDLNCLIAMNEKNSATSSMISSTSINTAQTLLETTVQILNDMSKIAHMHLSLGQNLQIKNKKIDLNYLRTMAASIETRINLTSGSFHLQNPCDLFDNTKMKCSERNVIQQSYEIQKALIGKNGLNEMTIFGSKLVSLGYFDGQNDLTVKNLNNPIKIYIPRVAADALASFEFVNASNASNLTTQSEFKNQILTFSIRLKTPQSSIHFQLKPEDPTKTYLMVLKYGQLPFIDKDRQIYDKFQFGCAKKSEQNEQFYILFSNISSNIEKASLVGIGIRELTLEEHQMYCQNKNQTDKLPILDQQLSFESNFYIRFYAAGCYYLDTRTGLWSSDGVDVLEETNSTLAVCTSTHLTDFAGGFIILPPAIDFAYAFANSSFDKNMTIYLTIIIVTSLYILLFVWCLWQDKRDTKKSMIHILEDNDPFDLYFYEMIVYTGSRKDSGTESKVYFNLIGSLSETLNRKLESNTNGNIKLLQRTSVDTFLLSVKNPLGNLSYIRIWHDNSGKNSSWFLKFIILHDLQTREKFYFVCNNWLSIEHDDTEIDRLLPVCGQKQKTHIKYLIEKQYKDKMRDGHLWFSVFARPTFSSFTRTDRLTCCFVLMYLTMLMNIMYYEQDKTVNTGSLQLGPFSISQSQIMIGVISNLIIFPPSFLLVQLFRMSRKRTSRSLTIKNHLSVVVEQNSAK
jgi:hypothetical protein